MDSGTRSILNERMDVPKSHFPLRLEDGANSLLPDGVKSPLMLTLDATGTPLNSMAESFKGHYSQASDSAAKSMLLQGLEGTMALLAARGGVEGAKGLYPLSLDSLRQFLPYGGVVDGSSKSYLHDRLDKSSHKSVRDRKESKSSSSSSVGGLIGGSLSGHGERTSTSSSASSISSGDHKRLHHHHHHHHHHDRSSSSSSHDHKSSSSSNGITHHSSNISSSNTTTTHSSSSSSNLMGSSHHMLKKPPTPKSQLSNPHHDANLTHAIRELHDEEFGLDAVLLAEGGGHVGAHCAVLAAASPFLKTILLHANDHPAIISVTGTTLSTLQSLVTCLYTGNIPQGASLYHLIEAAKLLRMEQLATVLQKTFLAQEGSLDLPPRSQHLAMLNQRSASTITTSSSSGTLHSSITALEPPPEKYAKKGRSNRLDQILYQKLNVNHLAPSDIPEPPTLVPPSQELSRVPPLLDSSRVPILDSSRVPPTDLHGGILGELLTKADPLRSIFANPSIYSMPDLTFDPTRASSLKPLNLSKSSKCETMSSSSASTVSSSTSTTSSIFTSTATTCSTSSSLASSLASQTDLSLAGLTSLAPTLPGSMPGLLTPLTPSNISSMISPSALASLSTSSALAASLGSQHHSTITSKSKNSSSSSGSRSRSSTKSSSSSSSSMRSSSCGSASRSGDVSGSSSHSLPLLYTLKGGMMTPEMAKEVYEQLKIHPQLTSLAGAGFNSIPNLSSLSSSASLQSLASLHNLSGLQNFPTLFPFLASATAADSCQMNTVENNSNSTSNDKIITLSPTGTPSTDYNVAINSTPVSASNLSSSIMTSEDCALNLSSSAQTGHSESPSVTAPAAVSTVTPSNSEETTAAVLNSAKDSTEQSSAMSTTTTETKEESANPQPPPPPVTNVSTGCQTVGGPLDPSDTLGCGPLVVSSSGEIKCTMSNGCQSAEEATSSLLSSQLDTSSLPLLLMTSGGTLGSINPSQAGVAGALEAADVLQKDPSMLNADADTGDDTSSIEVVDEIPGISQTIQNRKALFHAGPMGRKRKGCGDCEGCQVVEDCGQCRFCRDKAKFGGPNRLKQVCVYKRCVHAELEPEDSKKKRKSNGKKGRGKCGGCDGCQRTVDCNECYACLHNAAAQPPARRKVCEMRVCEQQQMEEVRATLSVAGEPSPYSTDSLMAEGMNISSGASSPTPDGQPSTHNDKMKLMRKMLKKKFAQPYSRVSPSKVRTKYYCGECPGCQTTTPCGNCLYCEDMPKFGGPGRYRQKCVKQLCVYHPRLQALKLSNRSKATYDEQHISAETLNHLGNVIPSGGEGTVVLGCEINPELKGEEYERLRAMEHVETDLTEGEDSNTAIPVETILEEPTVDKSEDLEEIEVEKSDENFSSSEVAANVGTSTASLEGPASSVPIPETGLPVTHNPNLSESPSQTPPPPSLPLSLTAAPTTPVPCTPSPEPIYESLPRTISPTVLPPTVPVPVPSISPSSVSSGTTITLPVPSGTTPILPVPLGTTPTLPVPTGITATLPVPSGTTTPTLPVPSGITTDVPVPSDITTDVPVPSGITTDVPVPSDITTDVPVPSDITTDVPVPSGITTDVPVPSGIITDVPVPSGITIDAPVPSGANTTLPVPAEMSPTLVPAPNLPALPSPVEPKLDQPAAVDSIQDMEDDDEEGEEEEEDEGASDSEVLSAPSTPSPPPRARGRGRNRGRGRPPMKATRQNSLLSKKSKVVRRGRRRRTTRFTLDPDDNSDFEEQLVMSEIHDENSTEDSQNSNPLPDNTQVDARLSDITGEVSSRPVSADNNSGNADQNFSSTSFIGRSAKPIDPDVFEFHDSQENVISNSHDTTYSLKPFAFRDEESSQGGRDVNENLGSVGETASA